VVRRSPCRSDSFLEDAQATWLCDTFHLHRVDTWADGDGSRGESAIACTRRKVLTTTPAPWRTHFEILQISISPRRALRSCCTGWRSTGCSLPERSFLQSISTSSRSNRQHDFSKTSHLDIPSTPADYLHGPPTIFRHGIHSVVRRTTNRLHDPDLFCCYDWILFQYGHCGVQQIDHGDVRHTRFTARHDRSEASTSVGTQHARDVPVTRASRGRARDSQSVSQ
jgi:hypothetical protein